MDWIFKVFELFATFAEGFIVFAVSSTMCGKKYSRNKHITFLILFSTIYTALITYIGTLQTFSFVLIMVAIGYSFAVNYIISKGNILLRAS